MKRVAPLLMALISGCSEAGYQQKGGAVSFVTWDEGQGRREHPVVGADAGSFEVLNEQGYGKDRASAYFQWTRIEPADAASFAALSDLYARDNQHVFYQAEVIPGALPGSFQIFEVQWGRDGKNIYLQSRPIEACDAATFVLLEKDWQRDSRCVYNRGRKLPDADPATFTVLNFWYGKDAGRVYLNDTRALSGADARSFVIAEPCDICGKDAARCYRFGKEAGCNSAQ